MTGEARSLLLGTIQILIGFLGIVALTNNETKISDVGLDGIRYAQAESILCCQEEEISCQR
jgi:hypothetical protein